MIWEQLLQHIVHVETENEDLQRQLAEAKDYIDRMEEVRV